MIEWEDGQEKHAEKWEELSKKWEELRDACKDFEGKTPKQEQETRQMIKDLQESESKELQDLVLIKEQKTGMSLLSLAVKHRVDSTIVSMFIQADNEQERYTIYARDKDNKRPIHWALDHSSDQTQNLRDTFQLLMHADVQTDIDERTLSKSVLFKLLHEFPDFVTQEWMDHYISEPVLQIILDPNPDEDAPVEIDDSQGKTSRRPSSCIPGNILGRNTTQQDSTRMSQIGDPGSTAPLDFYPMLSMSICNSKSLQETMNENSTERHVVFVMLADFYANCALIVLFLYASEAYVRNMEAVTSIIGIYIVVGYMFLRQILTIRAQYYQYVHDWWNLFDVCRMILVLASGIAMDRGGSYDETRELLLFAGAFVFIGMVSFLRNTFLPFSRFVSGAIHIFKVLIPFFVVSGLVLLAFASMYFINEFDEDCACEGIEESCRCESFSSLRDAFHTVYSYFVGGLGESENGLDIVFGIIGIIVFLNVVIAIVSDAWEEACEQGNQAFWLYRLGFLAELRPLEKFLRRKRVDGVVDFGKYVDSLGNYRVFDRHDNEKSSSKEDESPSQLRPLKEGSDENVESDASRDLKKYKSFYSDWTAAKDHPAERRSVLLRFTRWVFTLCLCAVLGVVTFGLLWPRSIRVLLFGDNKTKVSEESMETKEIKSDINTLKKEIEDLKKDLKSDIDEILQAVMKLQSSPVE